MDTSPIPERPGTSATTKMQANEFFQNIQDPQHEDKYYLSKKAVRRPLVGVKVRSSPFELILPTSNFEQNISAADSTTTGCTTSSLEGLFTKKAIAHGNVRCAQKTSCKEQIVANVCVQKGVQLKVHVHMVLTSGLP